MSMEMHIAFNSLTHAEFLVRTDSIIANLKGHPLIADGIPPPFLNLEQLDQMNESFRELFHAAKNGDRVKISQRDLYRPKVQDGFIKLGLFVRAKAGDDPSILVTTGFEVRERAPRKKRGSGPLPAPSNVKVKHGELSGVLLLKCSRVPAAINYEVQIVEGDASVESNWQPAGHFVGSSRIEIPNLEPGKKYFFRIRCIGAANAAGPWSTPVSLICM